MIITILPRDNLSGLISAQKTSQVTAQGSLQSSFKSFSLSYVFFCVLNKEDKNINCLLCINNTVWHTRNCFIDEVIWMRHFITNDSWYVKWKLCL